LASKRFKPTIEPLNPRNPQQEGNTGDKRRMMGQEETQWLFGPFVHHALNNAGGWWNRQMSGLLPWLPDI
jgi:hypothetical protein